MTAALNDASGFWRDALRQLVAQQVGPFGLSDSWRLGISRPSRHGEGCGSRGSFKRSLRRKAPL